MPHVTLSRRLGGPVAGMPVPGHAAQFASASQQRLTIASNSSLQIPAASPITLAAWVYPTAAGSYRRIMGKGDAGGAATDEYFLQIAFIGGVNQWEFGISSGAAYRVIDSGAGNPAALNQWTFLCGQYRPSDGAIGLQINGTYASTVVAANNINTSTKSFDIGAVGASTWFDGLIDAAGLWTSFLTNGTGSQIDQLYNGANGRRYSSLPAGELTGLVSWWDLDEPGGATWKDAAGTNNLTNVNGVTSAIGKT